MRICSPLSATPQLSLGVQPTEYPSTNLYLLNRQLSFLFTAVRYAKRKLNTHVHPQRRYIQKVGLAVGIPSSAIFVNTLFNSAVTC